MPIQVEGFGSPSVATDHRSHTQTTYVNRDGTSTENDYNNNNIVGDANDGDMGTSIGNTHNRNITASIVQKIASACFETFLQ